MLIFLFYMQVTRLHLADASPKPGRLLSIYFYVLLFSEVKFASKKFFAKPKLLFSLFIFISLFYVYLACFPYAWRESNKTYPMHYFFSEIEVESKRKMVLFAFEFLLPVPLVLSVLGFVSSSRNETISKIKTPKVQKQNPFKKFLTVVLQKFATISYATLVFHMFFHALADVLLAPRHVEPTLSYLTMFLIFLVFVVDFSVGVFFWAFFEQPCFYFLIGLWEVVCGFGNNFKRMFGFTKAERKEKVEEEEQVNKKFEKRVEEFELVSAEGFQVVTQRESPGVRRRKGKNNKNRKVS